MLADVGVRIHGLTTWRVAVFVLKVRRALLDIDHGTYPMSRPATVWRVTQQQAQVWGQTSLLHLGYRKAYTTRVGGGPFQRSWIGMCLAP